MSTPIYEHPNAHFARVNTARSSEDGTFVGEGSLEHDRHHLAMGESRDSNPLFEDGGSDPQTREEKHRLDDDLAMLQVERAISDKSRQSQEGGRLERSVSMQRSRSRRSEPVDDFDAATNPLHETTALYKPPEDPANGLAKFFKWVHDSSFIVRYVTYIVPLAIILLIPLLLGALVFKRATVGGVELKWFSIWLEIVWLTLWAGRILARCIPVPMGLVASVFTNNAKKWRDLGKQLEVPATIFYWLLGVEISFLPTMTYHHLPSDRSVQHWEKVTNKVIVSLFVGATLNFIEKILIQLIAISFHLRTYADRIELNKFQIGSLTKLYTFSKSKINVQDSDFEDGGASGPASGTRTPLQAAQEAKKVAKHAFAKVGDVAGAVAGEFTGKQVTKSDHPHQIVLTLLNTTSGSQVLARRLYRTFVRDEFDTVFSGDLKSAFDNEEEAEAAFSMFDKDMNGDISMEELEAVCVEIGRERKSITASLKDLDSVVSKLDHVLFFVVVVITILVFLSLISTSAAGVLTSAGSTVLALSWLFSATAQEFLQSVIFVFVKHPFDVGDRVSIYGNTGSSLKGDDYFVKEISLLYTEFKKMEGHVVQAPNSYLNTLFILNMRRSGGLAEALPIVVKFGTTLEQIDALRQQLLEFVRAEKREYQGNILTELRDVTEAFSLTINVVFFYKSNWQNELLRLQRRNKFICALMVTMQELGIEGPRRNIPGSSAETPYHVNYPPPQYSANKPELNGDAPIVPTGSRDHASGAGALRTNPSILRNRAGSSVRPRGESVSSVAKRVDFSLGMKDYSSGDLMSDVSDRRSPHRVLEIARSTNREDSKERIIMEEEEESSRATGRSTSRDHDKTRGELVKRAGTDLGPRLSTSSSVHRNRFFNRLQRGSNAGQGQMDGAEESLMEQGKIDPRTGTVTRQAIKEDTAQAPPLHSRTEDFEMKRLGL